MKSSFDAAMESIKTVFNDKSVTLNDRLENLQGLRDELDILIDAAESDIDDEEDIHDEDNQ